MAKKVDLNTSYSVNFNLRDRNSSDDVKTISMNWENRTVEEIQENLVDFHEELTRDFH